MSLFAPVRAQQSSNYLVEFRAGKMSFQPNTNMVNPDKRKGTVYVYQSEDSLMHFCWKDRNSGTVEDDLIIFPEDAEFVRVKQCKTGRVFLLKIKPTNKKHFFWMQEPKTDKDEELCKKVNEFLNHPPPPSARGGRAAANVGDQMGAVGQLFGLPPGEINDERLSELQSALGGADQQQLMQFLNLMGGGSMSGGMDPATMSALFGGAGGLGGPVITDTPVIPEGLSQQQGSGPSSTPSSVRLSAGGATGFAAPGTNNNNAASAAGSASGRVQLTDLQSILANMNVPQRSQDPAVQLEDALAVDSVARIAAQPVNQARLASHLPVHDPTIPPNEELMLTLRSPQFRQATEQFGMALQTGQLGPLMTQFGLSPAAVEAANRGDVMSFADMLQQSEASTPSAAAPSTGGDKKDNSKEKSPKKTDNSSADKPKEPDDDEGMELD